MTTSPGNPLEIHSRSIVIDGHSDALGDVLKGQRRLGERSSLGQFDIPRALEGGLTAQLTAIFFDPGQPGSGSLQAFRYVDAFHQELVANPGTAMQAVRADDIVGAKGQGKVALMLTMEEVLALSEFPVVVTHGNCQALWPGDREVIG